ncbi:hypothetical protein [Actinoplanes regularis]|uniref:Thymidylate synthase n=1 Tax=Actinoplanes regularis TaxID=52697 RepID=A0A239IA47_9ACTN|nr:hypothetical protein [Actinoplanes regularis]GIE90735.1 hypothetical protein Are01nite_72150 [Actinoplanes regularis]SNS90427.1 hypothetical protein SAMN06264365_12817 [Actinoplanes regularis]
MSLISVEAADVSAAWLAAARRLHEEPKRKAIHTVVRINHPVAETAAVRDSMDKLLADQDLQCVDTVANTIFPEAIARTSRDHAQLVERYVRMYPLLRKRFSKNDRGTYFGRLIQYPTRKEPFDQIGAVIDRILIERKGGVPKRARYEATVSVPDDATSVPIYVPGRDNSPMAFPCLSHCSFQTDPDGQVHLLATYRSQYLVQRGYGNYLGLGRLLAHVARQTDLQVGHLTVVAGLAHLESPIIPVRTMLARFPDGAAWQ